MVLLLELSRPFTDPVLIFAVAMVIILIAPLVFQRLRVPGLVGLILAGMAVGPHGANILDRDPTIVLLGTVGLLYLMFLAGLEINLTLFNKHRNRSLGFGALTFFVPISLGTVAAYYFLGFGFAAAILLGSMFASHTLLSYPIASRLGLSKTTYSTTAVGATIITDVAALLVLAIVAASTRGALDAAFWIRLVVALALFVVIVFYGIPRLGRWFFRHVSSGGAAEFVFVLATVFVAAVLAELAGVEAIIGAFLAGLSLNRLVPEHGALMNRISFVGESLFIPFFLLSVGMLVDLRVLTAGADAWIVAGTMVVCVMIGKYVASHLIRPMFGHSSDEANFVFGLTVPQAAATLAAALIGFEVGLFDSAVLNGSIVMILVTCIVGPYATDYYGRRLVLAAEAGMQEAEEIPERILVPLANPATAETLMDMAFFIREGGVDDPVFPLTVVRESDPGGVATGEKLVSHAVVHAAAADVPVVPMTRVDNDVVSGIERAIRERRVTTVVIGWNGQLSVGQRIFGSVLDRLLEGSREMVLVCRTTQPLNTTRRVVMLLPPVAEYEPGFEEAARAAKRVAAQVGAELVVVSEESAQERVGPRLVRLRPDVNVTLKPLQNWGDAVDFLDDFLEENDLLIMLSAREGSLSWRPALNRLPRVLSQRFEPYNFVTVYPAETAHSDPRRSERSDGDREVAPWIHSVSMELPGVDLTAIAGELIKKSFEDDSKRSAVVHKLMGSSDTLSPEIRPGVVLLHGRIDGIENPLVFLGLSRDGVRVERASNVVHAIIVVLSPIGTKHSEHVQTLAAIARKMRSDTVIDALKSASTEEEVRGIIANEDQPEPGPAV